ncbi:HtaA domain-containing protein [Corynebacterium glutamicum]|uniref:HtaA domain-containing protein n=1 Tax=Corynebacterium glutamicum TaxID=1718 RepID=UPI001C6DFD00|nr:HtaA domain-containing protein [Corynebacterium glutamicum]QYR17909.1 HtaA domain-containing protein [Corynebacterium glutamicum]
MTRLSSALLAASVAGAALAIPATSAHAAESICTFTGDVGWNVRDSFNSYLLGNIANGSAYKHKGGLDVRDGVQTDGNGKTPALTWPVDSVTSSKISTSGGAHWTGHNLYTGDDLAEVPNNFTLDLDFSNITVELSGSTGRLLVDYTSREYINTHTLGEFQTGEQAELATITFAKAPDLTSNSVNVTGDVALTADGVEVFGGFYTAGEELAPITLNLTADEGCGSTPEPEDTEDSETPSASSSDFSLGSSSDVSSSSFGDTITQVLSIGSMVGMAGLLFTIVNYFIQSFAP